MSSRSDLAREAYNFSQAATAVVASSIFVLILKIICCCQFRSSLFHLHSTFDYDDDRQWLGLDLIYLIRKGMDGAAQQVVELGVGASALLFLQCSDKILARLRFFSSSPMYEFACPPNKIFAH